MTDVNRKHPEPSLAEREALLLGAPLGRDFLGTFVDHALDHTLFTSLGLGDVPGTATFVVEDDGPGTRPRSRTVRHRKRRNWHEVPAGEVRALLREAVAREEWRAALAELDEARMLENLSGPAEMFGFGGGDVVVWRLTALAAEELRPVAAALVRSPATAWWWDPVERSDQRQLVWTEPDRDAGAGAGAGEGGGLAGVEEAMRRDMARERAANRPRRRGGPRRGQRGLGAVWWSAPDFAAGTWTTGPRGGLPALELGRFVDTFTPFDETTGTVVSLTVGGEARVAEIRGPQDWRELVTRFPRDVSVTHNGEWRDWGDADGPWYLPDWEALAEHYDGVHVTVGGYLSSCGLAQPVLDGHTMLAGWVPDATVWVRDVAMRHRRLGVWHGHPQDAGDWEELLPGWRPL
ncbi:hypothetical protein FM076_30905 [Streptomyces albus subsp. chlorinus]|uniref:hypothetical protein n=1 Tax=Streptomyces albus TaxID=1888 RepID=UPI0015707AD5|nr:hypothetical protein [Streptomyces albus]NSC25323.1 hypothetical protein [Streptomyces albus subsp. chlorinus]